MSTYVTIEDAAKALGCTKSNIYQLIKTHHIETIAKTVIREHKTTRRIKVQHVDMDKLNAIYE